MSAVSASRRSLRRAATATVAPCSARARAVASPIPLLAPVTSATVSCSALVMARGLLQDAARARVSYAYTPSSHALRAASLAAASTPSSKRCALIPTTLP